VHFAVRRRTRRHGLPQGRPLLPLQEPGTAAPGPGYERQVDRQPVHRAGTVRPVLQAGRVLHHQAEDDEQAASQDTAILQEVPARLVIPRRRRRRHEELVARSTYQFLRYHRCILYI